MRLPNDVSRCYGVNGAAPCPARETCARFCQLPLADYNTPAHMHMCQTRGQTVMQHYIKQESLRDKVAD